MDDLGWARKKDRVVNLKVIVHRIEFDDISLETFNFYAYWITFSLLFDTIQMRDIVKPKHRKTNCIDLKCISHHPTPYNLPINCNIRNFCRNIKKKI